MQPFNSISEVILKSKYTHARQVNVCMYILIYVREYVCNLCGNKRRCKNVEFEIKRSHWKLFNQSLLLSFPHRENIAKDCRYVWDQYKVWKNIGRNYMFTKIFEFIQNVQKTTEIEIITKTMYCIIVCILTWILTARQLYRSLFWKSYV